MAEFSDLEPLHQNSVGAKMKLGFINGKIPKPTESDEDLEQWIRADYMVTSWVLNSISKDIVESFLYTSTTKELWEELEARFGESNGPQIYQIRREIASVGQGSLSISAYFSKIKKLWDELACLAPTTTCSCGASKEMAESRMQDQLMQFFMGLDDSYNIVRNQILMMEPLPSVTKAYSMVLRVEKQREVSVGLSNAVQNMAMQVRGGDKRFGNFKNFQKRKEHLIRKILFVDIVEKWGMGRILALTYMEFQNEVAEELTQNALDENTISELIRAELRRYIEGQSAEGSTVTDLEEFDSFSDQTSKSKGLGCALDGGHETNLCGMVWNVPSRGPRDRASSVL
ncbi:hypothetical protein Sango_2948400 [Sesamum angolense]|uniref:Retrotransposon gag domain-containing protein n=1 Tax=Sesamum angolense TaxID=2727404 RepID=A0AAE1T4X7_9LAMI|nr:hypothetical protein Sango_2948400 [Sesamum angolense]